MDIIKEKNPTPPLGVVAAIVNGFEAVQAHLWLILPPIVLDMLFWLGPQLSIPNSILNQFKVLYEVNPVLEESIPQEQFLEVFAQFNLLTSLSPSFIGVPSLVKAKLIVESTPLGLASRVTLGNEGQIAIVTLGMLLIGFILTTLYFKLIAGAVAKDTDHIVRKSVGAILKASLRVLGFTILLSIIIAVCSGFLFAFSAILGQFISWIILPIILIGFSMMLWLLLFNGFAIHGMMMQDYGIFKAIQNSIALVRVNASQMTSLFLLAYILYVGLRVIWAYPETNMWLFGIGIVGHAFIATAVLAATFVFYQDRMRWQREMEALSTNAQS